MRSLAVSLAISLALLVSALAAPAAANGFDQYGYNRTARVFQGPASGYCLARGWPADCQGIYSNDNLVMKWNAEWDRGNATNRAAGPYRAYLDNEWNGNGPGGSGYTEHFKAVWVGPCGADGTVLANGGYCLWGQFEAIFDRGMDPSHTPWILAHAKPAGYGSYP